MSYGLRFQDDFFDVDEHKWKLRIYKKDYTGNVETNTLVLGGNPVQITYEQGGDDFYSPIIGSSCRISMYVTEDSGGTFWQDEDSNWESANFTWEETNFDFVQPIDDREYKVQILYSHTGGSATSTTANKLVDSSATFTNDVKIGDSVYNLTDGGFTTVTAIDSGTTLSLADDIFASGENYLIYSNYWVGFIIQDQYTLPMKSFPFMIDFYAADLLGTIDGYNYAGTTERPSALEVIRECLKNINEQNNSGDTDAALKLDYQTLCRIKPNTSVSNGDPFLQTFIRSKTAMNDENDIAVDCKTILESILKMFNCRIFQRENKWVIISNDAMGLSEYSGTGKVFNNYDYNNVGASTGTTAITGITKNVNSTMVEDTIQPMGDDLLKILKRPCISTRTNVRIKDMLFNELSNGTYEDNTAPSGSTPSWGRTIDFWQTSNGFATSSTEYAVNSTAADTSGWPVVVYGIQPAAGEFSALTIGNESSAFTTSVLKNTSGSIASTNKLNFKFSHYASDPEKNASTALAYTIRYRLKVGTYYWDNANQVWTTDVNNSNNSITGTEARNWIENNVQTAELPQAGQLDIEFFRSQESAYNNSEFRMYFDNVIVVPDTNEEVFSTKTTITKSPFNDNSGVLKKTETRFGQIGDLIYANTIVNSSGALISNFTYFDNTIISDTMNLEVMMNTLRLNDLATSNDRFEGTFRKVNEVSIQPSGNRINRCRPIDMLSKPKLNFTSVSGLDNELAIDKMIFDVSKNRYKLITHTPGNKTSDSALNSTSDISFNRNFYRFNPEK
jgi:hypothetical protein